MASFFAGVLLPKDKADLVDSWRKKFYPEVVSRHPPHITVLAPFSTELIRQLAPKFHEVFSRYPEFRLKAAGSGVFPGKKAVLHLRIEPNEDLARLHSELNELAGTKPSWNYNPHITVAKLESPDLEVAKQEIEKVSSDFDFVATKKVLFKERSDGSWGEFLSVS